MRRRPLCHLCKRYQKSKGHPRENGKGWVLYCEAYPDGDGIPLSVYRLGHFKPKPGDHGLQFIPRDDVDPDIVDFYHDIICANEDEEYVPLPDYIRA